MFGRGWISEKRRPLFCYHRSFRFFLEWAAVVFTKRLNIVILVLALHFFVQSLFLFVVDLIAKQKIFYFRFKVFWILDFSVVYNLRISRNIVYVTVDVEGTLQISATVDIPCSSSSLTQTSAAFHPSQFRFELKQTEMTSWVAWSLSNLVWTVVFPL